jgi:hypothetical protein
MSILTSSTRVSSFTSIKRARLLPNLGQVFVRIGQDVNPVQVIAQSLPRGGYYTVRADEILGVPVDEVFEYILVEPGASLRKGMPILRKPGKLGRSKVFESPISGVLVDIQKGTLIMQSSQETIDLRAMIQGRISSVVPGRGAVIETRGGLVQAQWDSGKEGYGKLRTVVRSAKEPLNTDKISGDVRGSVLIGGWISLPDDLYRLENSGVRGVIAGSMPSKICLAASTFSFPIFLTDGVGEQAMSEPIFQILQRADGNNVSLLTKQDGAKGQRSEIIIPSASSQAESPFRIRPIENGDLVRVFRYDGSNLIGRVSGVAARPKFSSAGLFAPGAEIEFGSGNKEFVPYTNLDLIS